VRLTDFACRTTVGSLGVGLHRCGSRADSRRPATSVDPTLIALRTAAGCVSDEELVAIIDSILQTKRVSEEDVRAALAGHPAKVRGLLDRVDGRAESGSESLARYRLVRLRLNVRPQVRITGVGRVDLMVGERLVIEVDSRAHHTGEVAYESDRRRDRLLVERDYVVIRVSYHQVLNEWADIERSILAVVRRRDHLRRTHTRNLTIRKPSSRASG
jgi:very-short-patch-repair endonuclease